MITGSKILAQFNPLRRFRVSKQGLAGETRRSPFSQSHGYYTLSPTCQIPGLDRIYEQTFSIQKAGTFVEIGAFDGDYASNTSCLADAGWFGIYVEPVPAYYELCKARHAKNERVQVFNIAIGDSNESKTLYLGGPLSTMDPEMVDLFATLDWAKGYHKGETIEVQQVTADDFLVMHDVPKGFNVLVIDVEGYEWNVLKRFDIRQWQPRMVIIELHDQNDDYLPMRDTCNQIAGYFDQTGYRIVYKDLTNTIYVLGA
ncbi:MAG: FkbM family methyltransferase [Candidatus Binatia bacterium]